MITRIERWRCDDGVEYATEAEALAHVTLSDRVATIMAPMGIQPDVGHTKRHTTDVLHSVYRELYALTINALRIKPTGRSPSYLLNHLRHRDEYRALFSGWLRLARCDHDAVEYTLYSDPEERGSGRWVP